MVTFMRCPGRMVSPSTTGTFRTAPTARMALSGGLMMAVNSSTSNIPRLEMVKVEPVYSSGLSFLSRARDKKLKPEEFTGSTFTISNLGMFDVEEFTAIINPPDSAILAVGAVRKVPVVDGETIRPGHRMKVTMSSDHRVIDGALSAQFLAEVRRLLEAPVGLLLG